MESQAMLPVSGRVVILADNREESSNVTRHLRSEADVVMRQLDVADYVCSDRLGIERKTVQDFLVSLTDGRLFEQLGRMKEAFERPVLIMEGSPERLFLERTIHQNAIRGAITSITVDKGIPMIWTSNSRETASQIFWMAKREQEEMCRPIQIRSKRKSCTPEQQQEFLVAGLPYINSVLSKRLLEEFKTVKGVFSAAPEELMRIEKIGKSKAKSIHSLLNRKYRPT